MKTLKRKSIRDTSPSEAIGVATAFILATLWKSFLGYSMFFGFPIVLISGFLVAFTLKNRTTLG